MLVEATLDFPEEEIDFLETADARGQLARRRGAARRRAARARARARCCAKASASCSPASRTSARARCSTRWPAPSWRSSRRSPAPRATRSAQTIQIEGVPLHVVDTAGLREASDEVERIGIARSWAEIERADAVVFLHDLTRIGERRLRRGRGARSRRACLRGSTATAALLARLQQGRRCAATALAPPTALVALGRDRRRPRRACARALLELAGWQAAPEGVFIARARHVDALQRTRAHLERAPARTPSAATPRSSCSPRSCASRTTRSARSPAPSAPTTCSARSSAASASASEALAPRARQA